MTYEVVAARDAGGQPRSAFVARIYSPAEGRSTELGHFDDEEAAARAYDSARVALYGDGAGLAASADVPALCARLLRRRGGGGVDAAFVRREVAAWEAVRSDEERGFVGFDEFWELLQHLRRQLE